MKRTRTFVILTLISFLASCGWMRAQVVRQMTPVFDDGIKMFMMEDDLELAEVSMGGQLKLVEVMLTQDPENTDLLTFLAQAYTGYAQAFIEEQALELQFASKKESKEEQQAREKMKAHYTARAKKLYLRAADFGKKSMKIQFGDDIFKKDLPTFKAWLKDEMGEDDVPVLFWTAISWGSAMNIDREDLELYSNIGYAVAMMEQAAAMNDKYFHGAPHLFLGGYYGGLPSMFGNNKDKALGHFKKIQEYSQNRHLLAKVIQAEFMATQYQDEKLFDRLIKEVLEAKPNVYPEINLLNALAVRKAKRLKKTRNEYF